VLAQAKVPTPQDGLLSFRSPFVTWILQHLEARFQPLQHRREAREDRHYMTAPRRGIVPKQNVLQRVALLGVSEVGARCG
jgi:hypothetical protein